MTIKNTLSGSEDEIKKDALFAAEVAAARLSLSPPKNQRTIKEMYPDAAVYTGKQQRRKVLLVEDSPWRIESFLYFQQELDFTVVSNPLDAIREIRKNSTGVYEFMFLDFLLTPPTSIDPKNPLPTTIIPLVDELQFMKLSNPSWNSPTVIFHTSEDDIGDMLSIKLRKAGIPAFHIPHLWLVGYHHKKLLWDPGRHINDIFKDLYDWKATMNLSLVETRKGNSYAD